MGGGLESRCVGRVYGADGAVRRTAPSAPYTRPFFTSRKYSGYSFLLEAESNPGPYCDRRDYVNENFQ